MKFIHIDPTLKKIGLIEAKHFDAALPLVGLSAGQIDFGRISQDLHIAVYEYGLYEDSMAYFSIRQTLFAGPAIIIRAEPPGDTVDVKETDLKDISSLLSWLPTRIDAEKAIQKGFIFRPQSAVNGEVLWQWGM